MASPASPRLPSPPPIAEDQLSPSASPEQQKLIFSNLDHNAARRIRPGTRAENMAEGPPLVELSDIDSAFQLTEHLKALHNFLTHPIGSNGTIAVDKEMALKLAQPPENVDRTLWLYELCRFLTQKANAIIVALFSDNPACSSITCPEMRASEWQYLCAVHDPPKSCCAIDYCCHTLDWAANTLTSPKHFPSRLALGTDQSTQHSQGRQLTNIFRRVYRIFAHAWFQHREMFWKVEGRTGLYIFFKTVCDYYGLIPEDNYTIPAEAEGIEPTEGRRSSIAPLILKREPSEPSQDDNTSIIEGISDHSLSTAGTTKRHRHSPSVGATAVSTVVEENEEEDEHPTLEPPAQEPEAAAEDEATKPDEPKESANETENTEEPVAAASEVTSAADDPEKQSASASEKTSTATSAAAEEKKDAETTADDEAVPESTEAAALSDAKDSEDVVAETKDTSSEKPSSSEPEKLDTEKEDIPVAKADDKLAGNKKTESKSEKEEKVEKEKEKEKEEKEEKE